MAKALLSGVLDLLFPPRCVHCHRMGAWFCSSCQDAVEFLDCRQTIGFHPSHLNSVHSVSWHRGALRSAVLALKYDGMQVVSAPLGELMYRYWRKRVCVDIVIPVALHATRVRARGYNQAGLVAREFARLGALDLADQVLVRERPTASQVGLGREDRWRNVDQAFRCRERLDGKRILLIDDVLTTGATMEAAAHALRDAGVTEVYGLTLTRASRVDQKT